MVNSQLEQHVQSLLERRWLPTEEMRQVGADVVFLTFTDVGQET
jgi:hypothetical protein